MSSKTVIGIVALVALGAIWTAVKANDAPSEGVPLLGTLVQWQYPGSQIQLNGSVKASDAKTPGVESARFEGMMTTPDAVEKVARFYTEKLAVAAVPVPQDPKAEAKTSDAKSVFEQDDSKGRPVQVRVVVVNNLSRSTTLVISRADGETQTHIAWSQYLYFDPKR
jgi:hypothetical protein